VLRCLYSTSDDAPKAVQHAVVSPGDSPLDYVIHPNAMPSGSALFLTFQTELYPIDGIAGIGVGTPVVLSTDTVPACPVLPLPAPVPTISVPTGQVTAPGTAG
jgi:hypothetical protein